MKFEMNCAERVAETNLTAHLEPAWQRPLLSNPSYTLTILTGNYSLRHHWDHNGHTSAFCGS